MRVAYNGGSKLPSSRRSLTSSDRKRRGVNYSLATLSLQKAIAVEIFDLHHARAEADRPRAYRRRPACKFIAKYNTAHDGETSEGYQLVPFEQATPVRGERATMDKRYGHLTNALLNSRRPGTFLMAMFICWRCNLHSGLLLELESKGASNFVVWRSVALLLSAKRVYLDNLTKRSSDAIELRAGLLLAWNLHCEQSIMSTRKDPFI